jgi:hypothetical protein
MIEFKFHWCVLNRVRIRNKIPVLVVAKITLFSNRLTIIKARILGKYIINILLAVVVSLLLLDVVTLR